MVLCFGTFASIIKECYVTQVNARELVHDLIGTIDPDNDYNNPKCESTAHRLLKCEINLAPKKSRRVDKDSAYEDDPTQIGTLTEGISNVLEIAPHIDREVVAQRFKDNILPMLNNDKIHKMVMELLTLIEDDNTIKDKRPQEFLKRVGLEREQLLNQKKILLPTFLAGLLLYTIISVDNIEGKNDRELSNEKLMNRLINSKQIISYQMPIKTRKIASGENEVDQEIIASYHRSVLGKHSKAPSMISRNSVVSVEDVYVCNDISDVEYNRRKYIWNEEQIKDIHDVTAQELLKTSQYAYLSGPGGIGKSMMLRHFVINTIKDNKNDQTVIFVTLMSFNDEVETFFDFVCGQVEQLENCLLSEELKILLKKGKCLLLLDGLDEIKSALTEKFEKQFGEFLDKYPQNQYIMSSRPFSTYQMYNRFQVWYLQPFTIKQSLKLIDRLEFRKDDPEIKEEFKRQLKSHLYHSKKGFSDNPLLLTIMLMSFEQYAEIPISLTAFYSRAFSVMTTEHDATKKLRREYETGLSLVDIERYFSEFCAKAYFNQMYEFQQNDVAIIYDNLEERKNDINNKTNYIDFMFDLCTNVCIMFNDNGVYRFIHRSFQEYFTALYLSRQSDEILKELINEYKGRSGSSYTDQTLFMLYEMIPNRVKEHIYVPYLKEVIEECKTKDGAKTFKEKYYPSRVLDDPKALPIQMLTSSSLLFDTIYRTHLMFMLSVKMKENTEPGTKIEIGRSKLTPEGTNYTYEPNENLVEKLYGLLEPCLQKISNQTKSNGKGVFAKIR